MEKLKFGDVEEMPADTARRERSIAVLEEKGVPYLQQLYVVVPESEAVFRKPEEVARRLLAMFGVCVYSEARSGGEDWEDAQKYLNKIDEILCGKLNDFLTAEEKSYLAEKSPNQHSLAKFGWRYECCHVLMWSLGFFESLGYPDKICDVSRMAKTIRRLKSITDFLESAKPRDWKEILDTADLILRYDWACVDARVNGRESPAGLDNSVVMEWHYAFNWLVGACENAEWDDIETDT